MAYDIFTQIRTPNISPSLYGDAAEQGARVGKMIPTKTTAILNGIVEGVETGQRIYNNQQKIEAQGMQNEITQHQVDRLPVADQIQDTQLEATQLAMQTNQLKLQLEQARAEDAKKAEIEGLKNEYGKYQQEIQLRGQENELAEVFANEQDPQVKYEVLTSGKYAQVYAKNPKLYEQHASAVYPTLTDPEQQNALYLDMGKRKLQNQYDKDLPKLKQRYDEALSGLNKADLEDIEAATGRPLTAVYNKIYPIESGRYEYDEQGRVLGDDTKNGAPKQTPRENHSTSTFDMIYEDPDGRKRVVAKDVSKDSKKAWAKYTAATDAYNGTHLRNQQNDLLNSMKDTVVEDQVQSNRSTPAQQPPAQKGQPQGQQPSKEIGVYSVKPSPGKITLLEKTSLSQPDGSISVSGNAAIYGVTQDALSLDDTDFATIKTPLKRFLTEIELGKQGYVYGYSFGQEHSMQESVSTMSKFMAEREFDTNPELQQSYTADKLAEYNKRIADARAQSYSKMHSTFDGAAYDYANKLQYGGLEKVETPRDMYIKQRTDYYERFFDNYRETIEKKLNETKVSYSRTAGILGRQNGK